MKNSDHSTSEKEVLRNIYCCIFPSGSIRKNTIGLSWPHPLCSDLERKRFKLFGRDTLSSIKRELTMQAKSRFRSNGANASSSVIL